MFSFNRNIAENPINIAENPKQVKHIVKYGYYFCCFSWSHAIELYGDVDCNFHPSTPPPPPPFPVKP